MKRTLIAMMMITTLITASVANAGVVSNKASAAAQLTTIPITGTNALGEIIFNGTFDVQRFAVRNGELVAIGTLTGALTTAAGVVNVPARVITLDVTPAQASWRSWIWCSGRLI